VCVVGEANAWPYRAHDSRAEYPDEIVHWVARRLSTGETFECIAAPRNPLSPSTPHHLELGDDVFRGGKAYESLLSEWSGFVRDTDVLCCWGCFATSLFAASGGVLPRLRFDLRRLSKQRLRRKLGSMDDLCEAAGPSGEASPAAGRAGRRLGQLVRVTEWLIRAP
jgi:hypothetical protein